MSRTSRRLYEVLGVLSDVDEFTLRRAYREACRIHPEFESPGDPLVVARLDEVHLAYSVLKDPLRREAYDEFGERSLRKGFDLQRARDAREREKNAAARQARAALSHPTAFLRSTPSAGARPGRQEWEIQVGVGKRLARTGGVMSIPVTRPVMCTSCDGSGHSERRCSACKGKGKAEARKTEACTDCRGLGLTGSFVKCSNCAGSGSAKRSAKPCRSCAGAGTVVRRSNCPTCSGKGLHVRLYETPCGGCRGKGEALCSKCAGSGRTSKSASLRLRVPKGANENCFYRYLDAGFSTGDTPSDLVVRFTLLARSPPSRKPRRRSYSRYW